MPHSQINFIRYLQNDDLERIVALFPRRNPSLPLSGLAELLAEASLDPHLSFGETVLKKAIKIGSFTVARFLIEVMGMKLKSSIEELVREQELFASPQKNDLKQRRFDKLIQIHQARQDCLEGEGVKMNAYWNNKIEQALEQDDADELQYIFQVNRDLILNYIDPHRHSLCQRAAQTGALTCLQYALRLSCKDLFKLDRAQNSLLHLAARAEQVKILEYLMDQLPHSVGARPNSQGESVLDVLQQRGNQEALDLYYLKEDPKSLDILPCGLRLSSFVAGEVLTSKGMALLLAYLVRKNPQAPEVFYVHNLNDDGAVTAALFDLFVRGEQDKLLLFFDNCTHKWLYLCEKNQGQVHIFVLDSITTWDDQNEVIEKMKVDYPDSLAKMKLYVNETRQQTTQSGCGYYSLKNLSLLMKTPSFYQELEAGKYFTGTECVADVVVQSYFLPARCMHRSTFPKKLAEYVKEHPREANKVVRITKEGVPQNLMKYCLHARPARYGVETPELVDNQDYDPEDKESTEKIVKNNSLYYFRSKYVNHVIPTFIQECSKQALACMLSYYDARFLAVDASGRIYNQKILRMQSQLQPHTFFYLPRPPSSAEAEPLESCLKSPR